MVFWGCSAEQDFKVSLCLDATAPATPTKEAGGKWMGSLESTLV